MLDADKMCVAWAISLDEPLQPLVVYSRGSLLYIYNVVRKGNIGFVRGHGGVCPSNITFVVKRPDTDCIA